MHRRIDPSAVVYPITCCVVLLVSIALARPFANSGFNDDWAYAHVALKFAETGGLHYNGWVGPMILFQTLWGALWIHLLSFSFNVLRAATIPFSLGFVVLVYALGRKAGLTRDLALFAAIVTATSPLYLPFACSFMTDGYGCFFTLLCIYAAVSSAHASTREMGIRWLWVLAVSGILGGSDRQLVWIAPFALIPYLLYLRRFDKRFGLHAIAAYCICIVSLALLVAKLPRPSFEPLELSRQQMFHFIVHRAFTGVSWLIKLGLSGVLICLPALACLVPFWKKLGIGRLALCAVISTVVTALLLHRYGTNYGLAPFLGNILTPSGILDPGTDALGFRPVVLPLRLREGITWLLLFSLLAFAFLCARLRGSMSRVDAAIFGIFSCVYIVLLFPGALLGTGYIFDRYLLLVMPLFVIFILLALQRYTHRAGVAAWACVTIFAGYGLATTHDYFSGLRARNTAAAILESRSIPRSSISAGLEYDGWTQLQLAGTIKQTPYDEPVKRNATNEFWFWADTSALKPEYVISYWRASDLPANRLAAVFFRDWLPPFQRAVVVLKRANLPTRDVP